MPLPSATENLRGVSYWRAAFQLTARSWREMFERRTVATNLAAGLTIALVALPLNLALALACGLPASAGLVTGAIAGALGALFGGSRLQVTGPEVALAPITLLIVSEHGVSGLLVAVFLCGLFQIAFGLLRLGQFVRLIPLPVIGGFLTAVGLLVFDSQLPRLLGLPREISSLHEVDLAGLAEIHLEVLAVGVLAVLTVVFGPKVLPRIPGPLLGLAVATALAFALPSVPTVEPFQSGFPHPTLPDFASLHLSHLIPEAFALALLASIDSLLCAASVDARTSGPRTRNDQELVAQGLANIASACVGGMPVAAAVVRSMAAIEARASSRLAPFSQAVFLALVLVLFAPFVTYVPLVALAAILLVVGYRLVDLHLARKLWSFDRFEAIVLGATTLAILFTDFVAGVALGSGLALVRFARAMERSLEVHVTEDQPERRTIRLDGPLFFASQARLERLFDAHRVRRLVVDLSGITLADSSGASALRAVLERLADDSTSVTVRHVPPRETWLVVEFIERKSAEIEVIADERERETDELPAPSARAVRTAHASVRRDSDAASNLWAAGGE